MAEFMTGLRWNVTLETNKQTIERSGDSAEELLAAVDELGRGGWLGDGPGSIEDERKALLQLAAVMPTLAGNATGISHAMGLVIRAAIARPLSFNELQRLSQARAQRWHGTAPEWSLSDWAVALTGELGEACNVIKKLNRSRDGIAGNNAEDAELRDQLRRELGDVAIYLDLVATAAGVDLGAAVVEVFNAKSRKMGFPELLPEGQTNG